MMEGRQGSCWAEFVDGVDFILLPPLWDQPIRSLIQGSHSPPVPMFSTV